MFNRNPVDRAQGVGPVTQAEAAWMFLLVKASLHRAVPGMVGCYSLVFEDGSELFWDMASEQWCHASAAGKPAAPPTLQAGSQA
jgi:hypothetical protein